MEPYFEIGVVGLGLFGLPFEIVGIGFHLGICQNQQHGFRIHFVAGLAHANHGSVWFEPNTPRGACFGVRIPPARAGAATLA